MAKKRLPPIEVGYQAFAKGAEEEFGAVRQVRPQDLVVYIEDAGDTIILFGVLLSVFTGAFFGLRQGQRHAYPRRSRRGAIRCSSNHCTSWDARERQEQGEPTHEWEGPPTWEPKSTRKLTS